MTDAESLCDDYVAGLLAKDAKESSIKYSALGVEAFLSSKYSLCEWLFSTLADSPIEFLRTSRSPIHDSYEISSRRLIITMLRYWPKKLQSHEPGSRI